MGQPLQTLVVTASKPLATCRGSFPTQEACEATIISLASSRESPKRKWFPKLAQIISRTKPAQYIAYLTGERERTSYDWCAGAVDPPSRVLIKLLHSPVGGIVIEELMRGCQQKWWTDLQDDRRVSAAYRQMELNLRR